LAAVRLIRSYDPLNGLPSQANGKGGWPSSSASPHWPGEDQYVIHIGCERDSDADNCSFG